MRCSASSRSAASWNASRASTHYNGRGRPSVHVHLVRSGCPPPNIYSIHPCIKRTFWPQMLSIKSEGAFLPQNKGYWYFWSVLYTVDDWIRYQGKNICVWSCVHTCWEQLQSTLRVGICASRLTFLPEVPPQIYTPSLLTSSAAGCQATVWQQTTQRPVTCTGTPRATHPV